MTAFQTIGVDITILINILPGCAESSSSETVESSSSEVVESSSSEEIDSSSSDGDESSSSSGGEECGTGTGHCPVSSSGSGKINSSSGAHGSGGGERGTQCYTGDEESCRPNSLILFQKRPVVLGDIKLYYHKPYCREDGNIVFRAGIPIVYFRGGSWLCLKEGCNSYHSIEGSWECNEGSQQENGCAAEPEYRSMPFYYSVLTGDLITSWGAKVDFSSTPESGMNLAYFDVDELLNIVARAGVFEGSGDNDKDLKNLYPQFSINSFDDYVKVCAYHLNIDVSSSSEALSSSSSFAILASSSSVQSSSSEESSSSVEESSSSYEDSSSSMEYEESSSSEKIESSSSFDGETLYSSTQVESSGSEQIESSSSEFVYSSSDDGVFVAGGDQVHSPDQIIRDGLDNMEDGKCYSLNPARGTQYGWMNTDAQDSWWWREVDCETGEKVDKNRVGVCPGFPLDNVPGNPKNACFAYNGTCYKCNPDRGSECSNSWLWQGTFTSANVGWWYEKVDCYDPFGEDFDGQCPDRFYLEKSVADNHDYFEIKNYTVEYSVSQKDYDALGRRLNGTRSKFLRTFKKRENKIAPISNNTFDVGSVIYIPIEKMGLSQKFLAKKDDQCTDYSCGNLGIDYGIGNDIGVYCGYLCTKLNMENGFLRVEVKEKVQTGSCGENNPKYTITFKLPATATIKRKNIYYVAPIGYKMGSTIVTKDAYDAAERHEIGHKKSFACLEDKKMFKSEYEFELEGVCEKEFTCNKNGVIKGLAQKIKDSVTVQKGTGIDALIKYNKNLWQKMCGWYHKNFSRYDGPGGPKNPKDIDCPTTETLLKGKYDLTGCEVLE